MRARAGRFLAAVLAATSAAAGGEGVTGWRGDGSGCFPAADPPTAWDADDDANILWRTAVGKSQSSPVVAGDRVFVTAEQDLLLCVDRKTGRVLWKQDNGFGALPAGAKAPEKRYPVGPGGGYSVPTPVTDGRRVYASYGTGIVSCHDLDGRRQWIRHIDLPQVTDFGRSASPRLAGGKLLVSIGALIALDPNTGRTLWTNRDAKPSYGTPALDTARLCQGPAGARIGRADVAITPNGDCVRLADGRTLATKLAKTKFSSPLVHEGVAYFACSPAVALKLPDQAADGARFAKLWENAEVEGEFYASPLLHDGVLYCANNDGVLYALDAATGKVLFRRKLDLAAADAPAGREPASLYASLTLAGKYLLVCNDAGETLVLAAERQFRQVAHNYLDAGSGASPAPDGKCLLLRGGQKLYCIAGR